MVPPSCAISIRRPSTTKREGRDARLRSVTCWLYNAPLQQLVFISHVAQIASYRASPPDATKYKNLLTNTITDI